MKLTYIFHLFSAMGWPKSGLVLKAYGIQQPHDLLVIVCA